MYSQSIPTYFIVVNGAACYSWARVRASCVAPGNSTVSNTVDYVLIASEPEGAIIQWEFSLVWC